VRVRDRDGVERAMRDAERMIYAAAGLIAHEEGIERALYILGIAAAALGGGAAERSGRGRKRWRNKSPRPFPPENRTRKISFIV
jgi:hypothetical protein